MVKTVKHWHDQSNAATMSIQEAQATSTIFLYQSKQMFAISLRRHKHRPIFDHRMVDKARVVITCNMQDFLKEWRCHGNVIKKVRELPCMCMKQAIVLSGFPRGSLVVRGSRKDWRFQNFLDGR